MLFLSTTVNGLENLAAQEIEEFGGRIEEIKKEKIIFSASEDLIYYLNYAGKRILRVSLVLSMGIFDDMNDIRKYVKNADFCIDKSFAVRTQRKGKHSFTSLDVNAVVGEEILKKCPNSKVDLEKPEITFLCWVEDDEFIFTMDTTGESLHRRGYRVYRHPAPINPVLASLMLQFAGWSGEKLVDPFCGSGTILIEAHHNYNRVPNKFREFAFKRIPIFSEELWNETREKTDAKVKHKNLNLTGIEKFKKHVKGCRQNFKKSGTFATCLQGDAENLHKYVNYAPFIITNPPFGLRIGSKKKIFQLYEKFAEELEEHFSGSIFTVIIPYKKFENYFEVLEKREIMYGDLHTNVYKLKI